MGREAQCECMWGSTEASVKALLESSELILRGAIRKKIAFSEIQQLRADGEKLYFTVGGDSVSLKLGSVAAAKWAHTISSPPPTLASKLGITANTAVQMIGQVDDEALGVALKTAAMITNTEGDLIVARVDTPATLNAVLQQTAERRAQGVPIWFIYPKGPGHDLGEVAVIDLVRAENMTDTKVASVSPRLTALRFVRRR